LLDKLELTKGNRTGGYKLRFGLIEIGVSDMATIANAMGAKI
jgi:hypothetical protein